MEKMKLEEAITMLPKSKVKAGDGKKKGKYPLYRCSNKIDTYYDEYIIDIEAIIIGTGGNPSIHYNTGKCAYTTQCLAITSKGVLKNKYIYYYLLSQLDRIQNMFRGMTIKQLDKKEFFKLEIPMIEVKIQDKIIENLDIIANNIQSKKEQLKKLEQLIKSQFVEMFGDIKIYKRLSDYSILITKGASPKWQGINYKRKGTLFITSENVREGYIDISKPKYLENKINEILPRSILRKEDILINIVGASIGRAAKYNYEYLANINQAVALVRTKNINNMFLLTYLNSEQAIKMYNDMKKGGARENLSLKNISDLKIPKATLALQNQFSEIVKQIDKQKFEIEKSLKETQELYESLMQEYFAKSTLKNE